MFTLGARSLRVFVVGEDASALEDVSDRDGEENHQFDVRVVLPGEIRDDTLATSSADCLVIDGSHFEDGGVNLAASARATASDLPVFLLVEETDENVVRKALAAGVTDAVPRSLLTEDPALLADRIATVVEREFAHSGFRDVYDAVAGTVSIHDPATGRFVDANRTLCDLLGYDREELESRTIGDITADLPGYDQERATNIVESVAAQETTIEVEWPLETADGSVRWVEAKVSPITIGGREFVLWAATEVTERRRRKHEYEQIFDGVNDVISVHDPWSEELLDVNETLCDLTGYSREALIEMDVGGFSRTDDGFTGERAYEIQQRVAATGESETVEWMIETASGEPRRLETVLSPTTIAGEDRVLALSRDVTERRQLEQTYRQVFESVSDGLVVHDPNTGEILDVNERYCSLTGYDREELVGSDVRLIVPEDPEYAYEEALARIDEARNQGPQLFEFKGQRKDGDTFTGEIHLSTVDIRGEERVLASVRDVTERRELERTYRSVFQNVSDGLVVHDPETGEIVDVNDRFCEMNGYERNELLGETVDIATGPDHGYEKVQAMIARARDGNSQLFEWQNQHRDGHTFPVEVHLSVVDIRGEEQVLASVRDVTERKRREREYEQIFNGVNDSIVIQDPETAEPLDANRRFLERLGYEDVDEIRQKGFEALSATDEGYTKEYAQELCHRVAATGEPETVEWKQKTSDGERRWIEAKVDVATIRGEERIVSMQRDITERKRREQEFEQIFHGVNDIINVYDPETKDLVQVNDTMCELTGYDRDVILDGGLATVSAVDEGYTSDRAAGLIDEVMEAGEPRDLEWRLETADGERRWLEVNATPATIAGKERLLTISRDVTEQQRSERRLRAILDRMDEAIFLAKAHEITQTSQDPDYVSAGYEDIWSQPLEGIRDRYEDGFFGTLHPDDEADYRAFVEGIVKDIDRESASDRYSMEYRIETPDGSGRWVQSDYYPVEWEDGPPRIVIVSRDITDRKERERRLVSFEEATDDLATADTPREAAETAVDAATKALNLSAVGVFLYDEDDGVLQPEVRSDALPAELGDRTVGPDDGSLWNAFATGTIVGPDRAGSCQPHPEETDPVDADETLEDWRGIPLGNHGVLFVGSLDSPLDPGTLQSAHVLGATLEAALNHLRGQRRLASREEELRTETARAERLDRIARLTQQVEAAITEGSDPGEVERAVCERLVDTNPYEVAWIGGVEVGTDRITPRTVVGESNSYANGMDLRTTDAAADRHPAVDAWQTDAVQVEGSLVGDGPAGDWRQHVLSRGYQSLAAIPLTYDGITHGVLTIAADSPNAFGDRAQSVLEQLGTSIGHALAGIKRRQALESDETIELEFVGDGRSLQFVQVANQAGCTVRHERTVHREDGAVSVYYALDGDLSNDAIDIAERRFSGSVEVVRDEFDSMLIEVVTDSWFGSPLAEFGAVLRRAEATPGSTHVIVELPARSDIRSLADRLQELAPSLSLEAKRQHQRSDRTAAELRNRIEERLTDRQHEALRTAFAAGYFEWPRENDGGEVADRLDITQPTFNKHLRIAERKTFSALFEAD